MDFFLLQVSGDEEPREVVVAEEDLDAVVADKNISFVVVFELYVIFI